MSPKRPVQLYVMGAGALGLRFALQCRALAPILLTRNDERRNAILRSVDAAGLPIEESTAEIAPLRSIAVLPENAVVLLCTKVNGLSESLEELKGRLTGSQTVVLCQNGLGVYEESLQLLPCALVVRLMARFGAVKVDTTTIRPSGPVAVTLSAAPELAEAQGRVAFVKELLQDCQCEVVVAASPETAEWQKTVVNLLTNSIATLLDSTNAILLDDPGAWRVAEMMLHECEAVAAASGIELGDGFAVDQVRQQIERYRENTNSTLVDLRAGRNSELPWLLGAVVAKAHAATIPVPVCTTLFELLRTIERGHLLNRH